jgi:hypothetical protein
MSGSALNIVVVQERGSADAMTHTAGCMYAARTHLHYTGNGPQ